MIYDNIDKGMYDLSSEKSGIRVGNESIAISSGGAGSSGALGSGTKLGSGGTGSSGTKSSGSCC
jgi:hypothetical protein